MLKRLLVICGLLSLVMMTAAVTYAANGTSLGDALSPNGQAQTVAPHSALWYQFDLGGKKTSVTATVDDNHASGIRLAIYTPDEISSWQNGNGLHAIGMGSSVQNHDLGWAGQFHAAGTYYAVVYNDGDAAVSVQVTVSGDAVTLPSGTNSSGSQATNPTTTSQLVSTKASASESLSGKLVFVDSAGGNIYTVNGDGTNLQRVSYGLDPQWSHDGKQIALARQGPVPGIYVINADGSNERRLYQTNEARSPSWSPDDSQIVFSYQASIKGGNEECRTGRNGEFCFTTPTITQWRLKIVNVADKSTTDPVATNDALTPTWNGAAGTTIAFNDLMIGIMQTVTNPAKGFAAFPFVGDLRITSPGYNPLRTMSPQYSPDGKKIVYVVQQQPTWQIALANADGSGQHLLTSDDVLADTHPNNVAPVWSPDSKQILFLSNRNGRWEFFVMNADGTNVHQVLKTVTDQITLNYSYNSDHMMSWTK
jgi:TolB protein